MATKHGKKFREAAAKVDRAAVYSPLEAVKLVKELSAAKFDETVEAHFRLGIDTRKADQNIRGSISLPHGTGKTVRVAVFAEGAQAEQAAEAGADVIGSDDLIAQKMCIRDRPIRSSKTCAQKRARRGGHARWLPVTP